MMFGIIEDDGTHSAMMSWQVMFCKIISQVVSARGPEDIEVALLSSVANPVEPHVDRSGSLLFAGSIGDPVCGGSGVAGCGWPISSRVVLSTVPSFALRKRVSSSASAAEDMMWQIILAMLRIGPLGGDGLREGLLLR